jgi:ABC-type uncharacterized transport system ATPase subunit
MDIGHLTKTFRYPQKDPGLGGSLRSVFRRQSLERAAVDRVSFRIEMEEKETLVSHQKLRPPSSSAP